MCNLINGSRLHVRIIFIKVIIAQQFLTHSIRTCRDNDDDDDDEDDGDSDDDDDDDDDSGDGDDDGVA